MRIVCELIAHTVYRGRLAAWHLPCGPVGPPARWAATSNVEVDQMKSIVGYVINLRLMHRFKTKVLSELLNAQTSHQPSSRFVILLLRDQLTFGNYCYILITYPFIRKGGERRERGTKSQRGAKGRNGWDRDRGSCALS